MPAVGVAHMAVGGSISLGAWMIGPAVGKGTGVGAAHEARNNKVKKADRQRRNDMPTVVADFLENSNNGDRLARRRSAIKDLQGLSLNIDGKTCQALRETWQVCR